MLRLLLPRFEQIVLTQYVINPRAMEADQLAAIAREVQESASGQAALHTAATPAEAWSLARRLAGPDDTICITGSFFLAAELRPVVSPSRVEGTVLPASPAVR